MAKVRTRLEEKGFLSSVAGSEEFERVCEAVKAAHDADRGLLLIGKCGRGKTRLMKALFALNYGREARWLYVKDGRHLNWMKDAPGFFMDKNVYLDDIGAECDMREYGSTIDVVGDFIQKYHVNGTGRLFATTNLFPKELNERYGMRTLSRLTEMCVLFEMSGADKREKIVFAAKAKGGAQ